MFRIIDWVEHLCARVYYGPEDSGDVIEGLEYLAQPIQRPREVRHDFFDNWCRDREKKHYLEMELQNAEWILDYEKRLAELQAKTKQAGINTDRRQKLEHHLAGLRRNISRD